MLPDNVLSSRVMRGDFAGVRALPPHDGIDFHSGGVALNDASMGMEYQVWQAEIKTDPQSTAQWIEVSAPNSPPITVHSGHDITEVSLSFDLNMQLALAWVEAGQAYLMWFDNTVPGIVTTTLAADVANPRIINDELRPAFSAGSDIILAYLRGGALYYRQQRDRYQTERLLDAGPWTDLIRIGMNSKNRLQFELRNMPSWPAGMPYLRGGIAYEPVDPHATAMTEAGRPITWRRYTEVPTLFDATWIADSTQAQAFESFYRHDLEEGTLPFSMKLAAPDRTSNRSVQFVGIYSARVVGPCTWEYRARMMLLPQEQVRTSKPYPCLMMDESTASAVVLALGGIVIFPPERAEGGAIVTGITKTRTTAYSTFDMNPEEAEGGVTVTGITKTRTTNYFDFDMDAESAEGGVTVTGITKTQTNWQFSYDMDDESAEGGVVVTGITKTRV